MSDERSGDDGGRTRSISLLTILAASWAFAVLCHQAKGHVLILSAPHEIILTAVAAVCLLRPHRVGLFALLLAVQIVAFVMDSPHRVTNHWTFLTIGAICTLAVLTYRAFADRGRAFDRGAAFVAIANFLRVAVVLLYFAVTLAKVNVDFLDPSLSSAAERYRLLVKDLPMVPTSEPWLRASFWGTLIVEGLLPILLLVPRARVAGLALGWAFHMILGLTSFYDFSAAILVAYVAFLPVDFGERLGRLFDRFGGSGIPRAVGRVVGHPAVLALAVLGPVLPPLAAMAVPPIEGRLTVALFQTGRIVWLACWLIIGVLTASCLAQGRPWPQARTSLARPMTVVYASTLLFLSACPYIGLHTDNVFTMFSNLQTEGDQWNHLLIPPSVRVFSMQDDLVKIIDADDPELRKIRDDEFRIAYFRFWNHISRRPEARVIYEYQGRRYELDRAGDDPDLSTPPHPVLRRFLKFRPVAPKGRNTLSH